MVIKGLEDYIPQEDFVDEAMLERIKKADEKSQIKPGHPSKASRNLPKPNKNQAGPSSLKNKVFRAPKKVNNSTIEPAVKVN